MEFLFFIFALLIGLRIASALSAPSEDSQELQPEIVPVKQCPPHQWSYHEVKDTEGKTVKWKLVCAVCGPMQSPERPTNNGDYS